MPVRRAAFLAVILAAFHAPARAEPAKPDVAGLVTPKVIGDMRQWLDSEIVRISVLAQNERLGRPDQSSIDALDKQWTTERDSKDKPLIAATLSNPLSIYLARMQGRSLGLYAEIFVMDQNGLNVGQSTITSDFWQGDEAKFQKTFAVGSSAVFVDDPEWDDDARIWRAQVSFTLTGDDGRTPVGAATVELNVTELQRRAAAGI